jgi:putative ATPase
VFEFKPVAPDDARGAIARAFRLCGEEAGLDIRLEEGVLDHIARSCGGDLRKAVSAAELLVGALPLGAGGVVTLQDAIAVSQRSAMRYDRDGDSHYDILSAYQKSMRGSDPSAAVHYLSRLLEAGDIASACRRLLVCAAEDVGLAYPSIIPIVKACVDSALQVGLPEARIPLAVGVILCANSPKSNSACVAADAAAADIKRGESGPVPAFLRTEKYLYPHSYPGGYVAQQYLPNAIKDKVYYTPGDNKTEQAAKSYWSAIRKTPRESP